MIVIVLHTDSRDIYVSTQKDAAVYGVRLLHLKYIHICMYM